MSSKKPRVLVINPNSSDSITSSLKASLELLRPSVEVAVLTVQGAPPAVSSLQTSLASAQEAAKLFVERQEVLTRADGIVIACFSDHPLTPLLKEMLPDPKIPVIGAFEASILTATLLGHRFGIVTTEERMKLMLEDGLRAHGFASRCVGIRAAEVDPLDLQGNNKEELVGDVIEAAGRLVRKDGAEVIVLGSTAMSRHAQAIRDAIGPLVPIVDGVLTAVEMVAGLSRQKLFVSGVGLYQSAE